MRKQKQKGILQFTFRNQSDAQNFLEAKDTISLFDFWDVIVSVSFGDYDGVSVKCIYAPGAKKQAARFIHYAKQKLQQINKN